MKNTPTAKTKKLHARTSDVVPGVLPMSYFSKTPDPVDLAPYIQQHCNRQKMDLGIPTYLTG